jgi:hypothetical protein
MREPGKDFPPDPLIIRSAKKSDHGAIKTMCSRPGYHPKIACASLPARQHDRTYRPINPSWPCAGQARQRQHVAPLPQRQGRPITVAVFLVAASARPIDGARASLQIDDASVDPDRRTGGGYRRRVTIDRRESDPCWECAGFGRSKVWLPGWSACCWSRSSEAPLRSTARVVLPPSAHPSMPRAISTRRRRMSTRPSMTAQAARITVPIRQVLSPTSAARCICSPACCRRRWSPTP